MKFGTASTPEKRRTLFMRTGFSSIWGISRGVRARPASPQAEAQVYAAPTYWALRQEESSKSGSVQPQSYFDASILSPGPVYQRLRVGENAADFFIFHLEGVATKFSASVAPSSTNESLSEICAFGAFLPACQTSAAMTFLPDFKCGAMSSVSKYHLSRSPRAGPLATRLPLTYSTKRWSALTLILKFSGFLGKSNERRKCSTRYSDV